MSAIINGPQQSPWGYPLNGLPSFGGWSDHCVNSRVPSTVQNQVPQQASLVLVPRMSPQAKGIDKYRATSRANDVWSLLSIRLANCHAIKVTYAKRWLCDVAGPGSTLQLLIGSNVFKYTKLLLSFVAIDSSGSSGFVTMDWFMNRFLQELEG